MSQPGHKLYKQIWQAKNIVAKPRDQHQYTGWIPHSIKCLEKNTSCLPISNKDTSIKWPLSLCFGFWITLSLKICTLYFLITHFYSQIPLPVSAQCLLSMFFWEVDKVGHHGEKPCATSLFLTALEVRHLQNVYDPNLFQQC